MINLLKTYGYYGLTKGTRLLVTGAVHGNETCGTRAINRVISEIDQGLLTIKTGQVTFIPVMNPLAYQLGRREGERNLNRNMRLTNDPLDFEDRISNIVIPIMENHDVLLDIHSFATHGLPFVFIGPDNNHGELEPFNFATEEFDLAIRLGSKRIIHGWMQTFSSGVDRRLGRVDANSLERINNFKPAHGVGTTETMRALGGYGLTIECGQHADPNADQVAYEAIINAFAHLGLIEETAPLPVNELEIFEIIMVYDRLHEHDAFTSDWVNFSPVKAGDLIAKRANGSPIIADEDGMLLFPNANAKIENEWFYFAKVSQRRQCGRIPA